MDVIIFLSELELGWIEPQRSHLINHPLLKGSSVSPVILFRKKCQISDYTKQVICQYPI
jgi:hypothetical protein